MIVFIGSWHKPNLEAVEEILQFAPSLPQCKFIIMGSQCQAFKNRTAPPNVVFAGIVDENMKRLIYSIADVAVNPMVTGSGTNLKIAEYMANGLPVVSTPIGVRGYTVLDESDVLISNSQEFVKKVEYLMKNYELAKHISENAFTLIKENYSWEKLTKKVNDELKKYI
ncbi:glycosyltransferase family 4 protein [Paenibacillus sp. P25]|nr:glycosyltransferase family 4 protein [Paenibacillus sp. P25]